jgi:hypothetical protein
MGLSCAAIDAHDAISKVCPVCFPDEIATRTAAHYYGVMHHSSMEEWLTDLASEEGSAVIVASHD